MTETGGYGYSCIEQDGIHINESQFIAEAINPDTLEPALLNEEGELVLTNLGRYGYLLIRYRTGDTVFNRNNLCSCGNSYKYFKGSIIGRADDMIVIRGINIYQTSIESIIREFTEISEFQIEYFTKSDIGQIKVQFEIISRIEDNIQNELSTLLRERIGLRIDTEIVQPNTLPRFSMKANRVKDKRIH